MVHMQGIGMSRIQLKILVIFNSIRGLIAKGFDIVTLTELVQIRVKIMWCSKEGVTVNVAPFLS